MAIHKCVVRYEECDCDCHTHEGVKHIMACCYTCPHCRRRIRTGFFELHKKNCELKQEEVTNPIFEKEKGSLWWVTAQNEILHETKTVQALFSGPFPKTYELQAIVDTNPGYIIIGLKRAGLE